MYLLNTRKLWLNLVLIMFSCIFFVLFPFGKNVWAGLLFWDTVYAPEADWVSTKVGYFIPKDTQKSYNGITLYKHINSKHLVFVINFEKAKITPIFRIGGKDDGVQKVKMAKIESFEKQAQKAVPDLFAVVNNSFFELSSDCTEQKLPHYYKVDGDVVTIGYEKTTKKALVLNGNSAKVIKSKPEDYKDKKTVIEGLSPFADKNFQYLPSNIRLNKIGRNYAGVRNDGKELVILVADHCDLGVGIGGRIGACGLITEVARDIMNAFGVSNDNSIMFDGSGSAQAIVEGEKLLNGDDRCLANVLAISSRSDSSPVTHLKLTSPTSNEVIPHSVVKDYNITWDYYDEKEGELGENVKLEFCTFKLTLKTSFKMFDPATWSNISSQLSCEVIASDVKKTKKQYSWQLPEEVAAATNNTFSLYSIEISSEKNPEIKDKKVITFASSECSYDDVSDAKYLKSVQTLCELGIIKKSDKFRPNDNLTRIEFLKMVLNAKAFADNFSDVNGIPQEWLPFFLAASKIIRSFFEKEARYKDDKVPKQPDGTNFEDQYVIEQSEQNGSCLKDGSCLIGWSFPFVNYAIKTGIMKGTKGGEYKPTEEIMRKEAITVLMRTLCHKHDDENGKKESYPICDLIYTMGLNNANLDDADLYLDIEGKNRSEFFAYIRTAKYAGFLDGYVENNLFKPEQPLKRWEMALSTCRLFTKIARQKGYPLNNICN